MKIILVNGKKRSGKDFFASAMKKELETRGYKVDIMGFADPLKDIISTTFDISLENLDKYKNNPNDFILSFSNSVALPYYRTDFRLILQKFGTEAMKKYFGNEVWVNLLHERCNNSTSDFVIVPDFRFECEAISHYTVHIKNNANSSKDSHSSENGLNNFEFKYIIDNTGYKDLTNQINKVIKDILK